VIDKWIQQGAMTDMNPVKSSDRHTGFFYM